MNESTSSGPPALESVDGIAVFRLGAGFGFDHAVNLVADAIGRALSNGFSRLMVCVREVEFGSPSLAARHRMARIWAAAASGKLRLAVVARPEFIDRERFGVVAATNFGLVADVFDSEPEALTSLREDRR